MGRPAGGGSFCSVVERVSRLSHSLVLVRDTEEGQEHLLPCVGWIVLDIAVIVGVFVYG